MDEETRRAAHVAKEARADVAATNAVLRAKTRYVTITPDSRDATKDFVIDEARIGSVEAQGLAFWSNTTKGYIPAHDSALQMLKRFRHITRK